MEWLAELKKLNSEPFDQDAAQQLFADVLKRLNEQYPFGAIDWAKLHRPELWDNCQVALTQVEAAFKQQDLAAVRRAVAEFEKANLALFKEYPGLPWRPGQKETGGKVWQLTDDQAQELETLFAAPGVTERKGALWYSPDAWGQKRIGTMSADDGRPYLWQTWGKPESKPEKEWRGLLREARGRLGKAMKQKDRQAITRTHTDMCYINAVLSWLKKQKEEVGWLWRQMKYPE